MADQDNIRKKAEALFNMTVERGCTQEEADLAAAKLFELAQKHGIDLASLGKDERTKVLADGCIESVVWLRVTIVRKCWYQLASNIAVAFNCEYFADKNKGEWNHSGARSRWIRKPAMVFVGFKDDAELAAYLFSQLHEALWKTGSANGAKAYKKKSKALLFAHYFVVGAGQAIRRRAEAEWRKRDAAAEAGDVQAIALRSLAVDKRGAIGDYLLKIKLTTTKPQKRRINKVALHGIIAGNEHGKEVGLRRALTA